MFYLLLLHLGIYVHKTVRKKKTKGNISDEVEEADAAAAQNAYYLMCLVCRLIKCDDFKITSIFASIAFVLDQKQANKYYKYFNISQTNAFDITFTENINDSKEKKGKKERKRKKCFLSLCYHRHRNTVLFLIVWCSFCCRSVVMLHDAGSPSESITLVKILLRKTHFQYRNLIVLCVCGAHT